jgi:coenzyme F420-0:L-glutamate ligase/coenzyme F420-1:gamma-L-glutamate ligase
VDRALATVAGVIAPGTAVAAAGILPDNGATAALRLTPAQPTPAAFLRLGADAQRLRAALAAEGVASAVLADHGGALLALSGPRRQREETPGTGQM